MPNVEQSHDQNELKTLQAALAVAEWRVHHYQLRKKCLDTHKTIALINEENRLWNTSSHEELKKTLQAELATGIDQLFPDMATEAERLAAWNKEYPHVKASLLMEQEEVKKLKEAIDHWDTFARIQQQAIEKSNAAASELHKKIDKAVESHVRQKVVPGMKIFSIFPLVLGFAKDVAVSIFKPVALFFTGLVGLWDTYVAYKDQAASTGIKGVKMAAGLFNFLAGVAAVIVFGVATTAMPIVLPLLALATVVFGLVKESRLTHVARQAVKQEKAALVNTQSDLERLMREHPDDHAGIAKLNTKIKEHNVKLKTLRNNRFQAKRKVGFGVFAVIGAVLAVAALAFPPAAFALAIAAAATLAVTAVIDAVDKRSGNVITRGLSQLGSRIKKWWRGSESKAKVSITPEVSHKENISLGKSKPGPVHDSELDVYKILGKEAGKSVKDEAHANLDAIHSIVDRSKEVKTPSQPSQQVDTKKVIDKKADDEDRETDSGGKIEPPKIH